MTTVIHTLPRGPRASVATAPEPAFVAARRSACGFGKPEADHCDELEDGDYCALTVDAACKKCARARQMRTFLADPASTCPLGAFAATRGGDDVIDLSSPDVQWAADHPEATIPERLL